MTSHFVILIIIFGYLIGLRGSIRGQTEICKVISLLEKLCTAMSNPLLVHHCCRWKEEAGKPPKLSHLCCIDGKCGKDDQDPDESDDYDEPTCTLPKCYTMANGDTCNEDFYKSKNSDRKLPAGVDGVGECCDKNEDEVKTGAECCIEFSGAPECTSFIDDSCKDSFWEEESRASVFTELK